MFFLKLFRKTKLFKVCVFIFFILLSIEILIRILEFGYNIYHNRVKRLTEEIDPYSYRVICVGESTVHGYRVGMEGNLPAILQGLLREEFRTDKIQVFNLGVYGFTAPEIAAEFLGNITYYRPHLVVLLVGNNIEGGRLNRPRPADPSSTINYYLGKSKIFKLKNVIWGFFKARSWREQYVNPDLYYLNNIDRKIRAEENKEAIEYMLNLCLENNIKVVMCNYFKSWYNKCICEHVKKYNLILCDNQRIYENYKKLGKESEILADDSWHPNEKGNYLIANNILEAAIENDLITLSDN